METGWIDHEEHVPGVSGHQRRPSPGSPLHGDGEGVGVSDSGSTAGWVEVGGNWPSSEWPQIDSKAPHPDSHWRQT